MARGIGNRPAGGAGPAFLVPVKSFADAKERLSPLLDAAARQVLARTMAEGVLRAIAPTPTAVVCDSDEVSRWAEDVGIEVIWAPGKGLNLAVATGMDVLEARGHDTITIVHADLPFPEPLTELPQSEGVLIVPDTSHDGTNVLRLPAGSGFVFSYGAGSFLRHLDEAARRGLVVQVEEHELLRIDVDVPADLTDAVRARLWGPGGPHASTPT